MKTRRKKWAWESTWLLLAGATMGLSFPQGVTGQAVPEGAEALRRMSEYLAKDGGKWLASNPGRDLDNERSPDAYGLWFETAAQNHVLELTVVLHFGDRVRRSIRGYWFWHPGRKEVLYHEVSPGGGVRLGTAHFTDEDTFVTLTEAFSSTGGTASNRGVNVFVTDDTHRTTAYARGPDGEWVEQQALTWTRTKPDGS